MKITIKKDSEVAKAFESLREDKQAFKENVQSGKFMPPHIKEKIDKLTDELKKVYELAEQSWEGCDGCDENDKHFWMNGFRVGYNRAKPDVISDEEALRLAKEMNKQPMVFVPAEISDDEIEKRASEWMDEWIYMTHDEAFMTGAKWYREKLKRKV